MSIRVWFNNFIKGIQLQIVQYLACVYMLKIAMQVEICAAEMGYSINYIRQFSNFSQ